MKENRSLVVYVIDGSGSMGIREREVIKSVNDSVEEHKTSEGETIISIYTFSSGKPRTIVDFQNVKDSDKFTYVCGGNTALYDAIGHVVNEIGCRLADMPEFDRPSSVQIMIITDGQENASREYNAKTISEIVKHQTDKYSWLFTYLGSNQDAILAGGSLGIDATLCASYTDNNFSKTMRTVTDKMVRSKGMDYSAAVNLMSYSFAERESLVSDDNR